MQGFEFKRRISPCTSMSSTIDIPCSGDEWSLLATRGNARAARALSKDMRGALTTLTTVATEQDLEAGVIAAWAFMRVSLANVEDRHLSPKGETREIIQALICRFAQQWGGNSQSFWHLFR